MDGLRGAPPRLVDTQAIEMCWINRGVGNGRNEGTYLDSATVRSATPDPADVPDTSSSGVMSRFPIPTHSLPVWLPCLL